MNKTVRYGAYGLVFLLVLIGLISSSGSWLITCLILAVLIGFAIDRLDNRRDEPFKKYNVKHHHLHREP